MYLYEKKMARKTDEKRRELNDYSYFDLDNSIVFHFTKKTVGDY